jgi:hypothetical protein
MHTEEIELRKGTIVENPKDFLIKFEKKAKETEEIIKSLFETMSSSVEDLCSSEYLLARVDSLSIEGQDGLGIHFFVYGFDIVADPFHNNIFGRKAYCNIGIEPRLILDYNHSKNRYREESPEEDLYKKWSPFSIKEWECENTKYGAIFRPRSNDWDKEIIINDFSEFVKFKELLAEAATNIGLKFNIK